MTDDVYRSPLATRYASPAMQALWSPRHRIGVWRRLWLVLAESERALGIDIPEAAIRELQSHLDDADLARAAEFEERFRHDVMAHIHTLGEQAPTARPFIHLGATSAFVTDNADLIVIRDSLRIVLGRLVDAVDTLSDRARALRDIPTLAYTHYQPAQLTTVGKRVTLWIQDFLLDIEGIVAHLAGMRLRGVKGTTGTQASFLELLGDHEKVRELDRLVTRAMGFATSYAVTGQTYPRKADGQVLGLLAGVAESASKFANDLRLLQHDGELYEPFESEQIGSSAMAYKRNPMRAERICSLSRFVIELEGNARHTAATQWLERTLDDSANRRLSLPEAFLVTDAVLILVQNVTEGLEARESVIRRRVRQEMPFMATERVLMLAVQAGGDRQTVHEVIRRHSSEAAQMVAEGGENDLIERLATDLAFAGVSTEAMHAELNPASFTGRARQQVDEFLNETVGPLLEAAREQASTTARVEVTV